MSENRRSFLEGVAAMFGIGLTGVETAKAVSASGKPLLVVTMSECLDPNDEDLARIQKRIEEAVGPDFRILLVPAGVQVDVFASPETCYHRESLANYEIEAVAANEEDLRERLMLLNFPKTPPGSQRTAYWEPES